MSYLGNSPVLSQQEYRNIDDISGSFNGSTTSFALLVNGVAPVPAPQASNQCLISVNGVIQKPDDTGATGFRLSGGNIVFSAAPTGGQAFFGVILAGADYIYAGQNYPDGTVSAPSITFAQDLDTGFYRSGAGEVKFTANGANTVTLSSNNLTAPSFIPTSSSAPTNGVYLPAANTVGISTNGTGRLFVDASGNLLVGANANSGGLGERVSINGTGLVTQSAAQTNRGLFGTFGGSTQIIGAFDNIPLEFRTNNTERLRITSAGLVGVGTSSPGSLLTVKSPGAATTFFNCENSSGTSILRLFQTAGGSGRLIVSDSTGTDFFNVQADQGRVGIGTSSPGGNLTVTDASTYTLNVNANAGGAGALLSTVGGSASLALGTNSTERVRITAAGNVGIGATPSAKLHVNTGTNENLWVGSLGGSGAGVYLASVNDSGSANTPLQIGSASDIRLAISGTEAARIDSSRRLLVGTSSARASFFNQASTYAPKIQLEGSDASSGGTMMSAVSAGSNGFSGYLILGKHRGSVGGTPTIVSANDLVGYVSFQAGDGSKMVEAAAIYAEIDGTPGANDMPGRLVFTTTADGASSPVIAGRFDQGGQFSVYGRAGINTGSIGFRNSSGTSYWANSTNQDTWYLFDADGSSYVYLNQNFSSWNFVSDKRLKENIVDLGYGINTVKQLKPRQFNFIGKNKTILGFVAQELQTVIPEAVSGIEQEFAATDTPEERAAKTLGVSQDTLIPVLVKALQEAVERIEQLEVEVAALKAQ